MTAVSQFKMTNVLGTMFVKGNLLFTPDSDSLVAPVGNKITFNDLKNHKSRSICFESTHHYQMLAISPNGRLLVAVNEIGLMQCISLVTHAVLHTLRLGQNPIGAIKFSPNGNLIAIGKSKQVIIYKALSEENAGSHPFEMVRVFKDMEGLVTSIDWSYDSKLIVVGSDSSPMLHVYSMEKFSNFRNSTFTRHRQGLAGVYFDAFEYDLYSFCRGGNLCTWKCSTEPEEWEPEGKGKPNSDSNVEDSSVSFGLHGAATAKKSKEEPLRKELTKFHMDEMIRLNKNVDKKDDVKANSQVNCVQVNNARDLAIIGYDSGYYLLVTLPKVEVVQNISAANCDTSALAFSPNGDWIGIGTKKTGELIVWEWMSESYIMKQQGHHDTIQCLDFSSDGRWIATGAHDGKVKLWETKNCYSFHTFSDHSSIVTGVVFMQNNKAVLSSSMDGTVRAYDNIRYRNFRVYTTPRPTQFCGVTIDASTTYVASGSVDDFNVFVWHIQSGRLLLEVPGHTGPISAISFSPKQGSSMLATVSWDKTLRIRDSIETDSTTQVIPIEAEGTALAFRADGKELTVATLNGSLSFFDPEEQKALGTLNGRYHMVAGRKDGVGRTADKNMEDTSFCAVTYSADGSWLLAGGKSINVCMYDSQQQVIIHKQKFTQSRGLDGSPYILTSKGRTDFGLVDLIEDRSKGGDVLKLPGSKFNGTSERSIADFQVYAIKFSPTGRMWAAASSEGVQLFTADSTIVFNPIGADIKISPQTISEALGNERYDEALCMALKLNIPATTTMVLENIPPNSHYAIANCMPMNLVKLCLEHLASILTETRHIEFHLLFVRKILQIHMRALMEDREQIKPIMSAIQKALNGRIEDTVAFSEHNKYLLEVSNVLQCRKKQEVDDLSHPEGSLGLQQLGYTSDSDIEMDSDIS